jgi:TRAP-type C4-dicarboxylate transport system permease small subunit
MNKVSRPLYILMGIVGSAGLLITMILIVVNTIMRPFDETIKGVLEIVELGVGPAIISTLVYTTLRRGHVVINLVFDRFPKRLQTITKGFTGLVGLGYWVFLTYSAVIVFLARLGQRDFTNVYRISIMPIRGYWAFCLILIVAILLVQLAIDLFGKHGDSSTESTQSTV